MEKDYASEMRMIIDNMMASADEVLQSWDDSVTQRYYNEYIGWYNGETLRQLIDATKNAQDFFEKKSEEMKRVTSC